MNAMPPSRTISPDAVHFGAIIRRHRERPGWTLAKLAQRVGMNPSYVSVVETGRNVPSLTTILELTEVLNVDAAEVIREVAAARNPPSPAEQE
jgi:transcriptional regulator with XRE-family HTH domain